MSHVFESKKPVESDFLVAFCDLTGFTRMSLTRTNMEIYDFLSSYYEKVGDAVESAGGKVVKFMGDGAMAVFTDDKAEKGILALLKLKEDWDAAMAKARIPCALIVKVHFGRAVSGFIGTRNEKRFDLFGATVNTAALTRAAGFAITPQAFRKLGAPARKLFKKHTPPMTYIPVAEKHNP